MANYATVEDVAARLGRAMSESEKNLCVSLLEEAALIIDASGSNAAESAKKAVSVRMVARVMGSGADVGVPVGATQGSMSALGYSQSWTVGSGVVGELYLSKTDRQLLGVGNRIGVYNPLTQMIEGGGDIECAALM